MGRFMRCRVPLDHAMIFYDLPKNPRPGNGMFWGYQVWICTRRKGDGSGNGEDIMDLTLQVKRRA
jgi:hypothetical protein